MVYKVIIIGGGPAGLMAANQCMKYGIDFLLLERNHTVGKKLKLTGGSRCNVTNHLSVEDFIDRLPIRHKQFLYPALYTFGPRQVIDFFNQRDCPLVLEDDFKYFPKSQKSQSVIDALMKDIPKSSIAYHQAVKDITKDKDHFIVTTKQASYRSEYVIIGTGSKSFPHTGSQGDGIKFASKFHIKYHEFTPAETHVYAKEVAKEYRDFQGITIKHTQLNILGTTIKETGDLLFTHFGLSGPLIYHVSEHIYKALQEKKDQISFSLSHLSEDDIRDALSQSHRYILKQLDKIVPKRISRKLLDLNHIENKKIGEISKKDISKLIDHICRFTLKIDRVEDPEKAYVNKGGIDLKEINPQTMACKKIENLFFVGETVDLHGPIGGYNITIALSTAYLAVQAINASLSK